MWGNDRDGASLVLRRLWWRHTTLCPPSNRQALVQRLMQLPFASGAEQSVKRSHLRTGLMKKYHAWLKVSSSCLFFPSHICLCFSGNVQSQQVWGVSWHEACAAGLQRCTGELLICLLVFWISKLTAKYVSRLHQGGGVYARTSAAKGKGREEGGREEKVIMAVWRPVAHRCLSAVAAGASTAEWNCSEGGRNTNKPLGAETGSQGGRWDRREEQETLAGNLSFLCISE